MGLNLIYDNGLYPSPNSTAAPVGHGFHDMRDAKGKTRAIVDPVGARTTFIYDVQKHTLIHFATGSRATVTSCPSQMTAKSATLSQFAAHVEFRSQSALTSTTAAVGTFLAHPESQRQVLVAASRALRTRSKWRRWLDDVLQQANLQLLSDLRRGKLIFDGDDPVEFVRWFRGAVRHAVFDAVKFCGRGFAGSVLRAAITSVNRRDSSDPSEVVIFRELGQLANEGIERIGDTKLREVMRDLRDDTSARDSAERLGLSKSEVGRMRKAGCRVLFRWLGKNN